MYMHTNTCTHIFTSKLSTVYVPIEYEENQRKLCL